MSIQEVARRAGVSIATVSRVFNVPDQVTAKTRKRVQEAAATLGYVPNANARTLRMQKSGVLGVLLPTLLNPVFGECLEGIAVAAAAGGYSIVPITSGYQIDGEEGAVKRLLADNVDGMILVVSNPDNSAALAALQARRIPYVLLYNRHDAHPCVTVDSEGAVAALVARLAALGHRRITMVCGPLSASDRAHQRYRGYLRGMGECGLDARELVEVPFMDAAAPTLAALLAGADRPTALVCSNDLLAIRCMRAAYVAGLQVPAQLTVVGFDGIELGNDLTPMLSTITQPNREMGRCGVELLVRALACDDIPGPSASVILPHGFREGESCAGVNARPVKRK
jgi:DNA-binding LacI/PurR family transcriptional regulator